MVSMVHRPMWLFLPMYEFYDMRHTCFPQVDGDQWGVSKVFSKFFSTFACSGIIQKT